MIIMIIMIIKIIMIIITIIIIIIITIIIKVMIIILISRELHSQTPDLIFAVALRFKDYTFHASGKQAVAYLYA